MGFKHQERKIKLAVHGRRTGWAPIWAVLKKYGKGKKVHPAQMTRHRRSWKRTKLHITPRRNKKWHLG